MILEIIFSLFLGGGLFYRWGKLAQGHRSLGWNKGPRLSSSQSKPTMYMQCATRFHLCSAQSSGQVDVSPASEASPYGHWRRTTNMISGAIPASICKIFLLFLAFPQSGVTPWRIGSAHTVTGSAISQLQAALPAMSQSECRPIFWALPPRWPPLFFIRVAWPHSIHLGIWVAKAKIRPATPTCTPARGEQAIFLCRSCSKCLVRGTKTFSLTSVRKSNILSNRNEK